MAIGLMTNAAATAAVLDEMVVASEALAEPGSIAPDRLAAIDAQRTALARAVQLIDVIGVGLLAVFWARRLYGNLRPLGIRELRFSEGWALGTSLVPVINLFRPKQIVNDIWRAGGPEPQPADAWDGRPVSNLLSWWWFFWVVLWLPTLFLGLEAEEPERVRSIGSFLAWCGVEPMISAS